jgi:ribosome-binding factor A
VSQDEVDPGRYFGVSDRARKGERKLRQLCRQVERSVAFTLGGLYGTGALVGATVVAVVPAPDAGRLQVTVALPQGSGPDEVAEAREALLGAASVVREEAAHAMHRKRVPELAFHVCLEGEASHG